MAERTYWNGQECKARIVRVIVADAPEFPQYWARGFVGQEREAVEVTYYDETFYIDNEGHEPSEESATVLRAHGIEPHPEPPGQGWRKVTEGRGSPGWSHSSLEVERVLD